MIYLKDAKGLNGELLMASVLTEAALGHLSGQVATGAGSPELARFVALAKTLPVHDSLGTSQKDFPGFNNYATTVNQYGTHYEPTRGVLVPGSFRISQPNTNANKYLTCSASPRGLGWAQVDELVELAAIIHDETQALGVDIQLDSLRKTQRQLRKAKWTIIELGHEALLAADGCVIYRTAADGFIDHKSETVALRHARVFENRAAAERAIETGKWKDAVIATISMKLEGLAPDQRLPNSLGLLEAALASRQAESLEAATPEPTAAPARPRF